MADRIKGITIEIGGNTTKLTEALAKVNTSLSASQRALRDVNKLLKFDSTNVTLLKQKQDYLKQSVEDTRQKLQQEKDALAQLRASDTTGETTEQQRALERQIAETESRLKSLEGELKSFGSVGAQQVAAVGEKMKDLGGKMEAAGKTLTTHLTVPIAALFTGSVKTAADFEAAMSQVAATMGYTTTELHDGSSEAAQNMARLREFAIQTGESTKYSATEAADALNYMALAGYDVEKSIQMLPNVLNLAASGNIEIAAASDMVTDAQSALGLTIEQTNALVDQMAMTASKSNTSVAQLGEGILKIGGTAKSLAGGTTELNTALGILADNGIKSAEGGTHLRNMILSLQTPTDKAAGWLEELGIQVYDLSTGKMKSLNDIFGQLNGQIKSMTDEERDSVLSAVFNKTDLAAVQAMLAGTASSTEELKIALRGLAVETDNAALHAFTLSGGFEAVRDAMKNGADATEAARIMMEQYGLTEEDAAAVAAQLDAAIHGTGNRFDELSGYIDNANGAAKEMAGTQMDNLIGKWKLLQSALEAAAIAIGTVLTPVLEKVIAFVQGLTEKFNSLSPSTQQTIVAILAVVAAIGPLLLIGGKLLTGIGMLMTFAPMVTAGFAAVSAPVLAIVAAIAALVAVGGYLIANWDEIKEAAGVIWDAAQEKISGAVESVKGKYEEFKSAGSEIAAAAKQKWGEIKADVAQAAAGASQGVQTAWSTIQSATGTAWANVQSTVQQHGGGIQGVIKACMDGSLSIWTVGYDLINSVTGGKLDAVAGTVGEKLEAVRQKFREKMDAASEAVRTAIEKIKGFFKFDWQLPHLKLPHISISGKFSLNPPSVPSFGISWYKKAMNNGMILTNPTIFGMQNGRFLGGGEAGAEAVVGVGSLRSMIRESVQDAGGGGNTYYFGDVVINGTGKNTEQIAREFWDMVRKKVP